MEYKVSVGNFDRKRHSRSIEKINNAHSGIEKELYFKNIARHILSKEGFDNVTTGPSTSQFQGVYEPDAELRIDFKTRRTKNEAL